MFDAREQLENIAADRIADLDGNGGIGKLAGIARIAEMVEKRFAEHQRKYGKGDWRGAM